MTPITRIGLLLGAAFALAAASRVCEADDVVVQIGAGSYATKLPPGTQGPAPSIYKTADVRRPMPTGDWWSSLAWMPYSDRQYPHPLAVQAEAAGLRVFYPGTHVSVNKIGIFASMPGGGEDLVLGHSAVEKFPDARVAGWSDWFVRAEFADGDRRMTVSYGHGSPYVYAMYEGGQPQIRFAAVPQIWSGDAKSPVLGITIGHSHYALFGPSGSTWTGLGTKTWTCNTDKPYFSLAVLPDKSAKLLEIFRSLAYAHVTDTRVSWHYDPQTSTVETTFTYETTPREGDRQGTLFVLYPHQWRGTDHKLSEYEYPSVRGPMRLAGGSSFTTRMTYPGVLPMLPLVEDVDEAALARLLAAEVRQQAPLKDTYWEGKHLGKLSVQLGIAEQLGDSAAADSLEQEIKNRLAGWFTAVDRTGRLKPKGLFYYDDNWGTLIGYPASYGSDKDLNDHHFHYGYFLRAAAAVARRDPQWAADKQFGGIIRLLADDIACPRPDDRLLPQLRCFDPYAGHSWASGNARFADGNNQESSSEAMNAWYAIILLGEATGHTALRDLGICLYTNEMYAINAYWFDVRSENRPAEYRPSVVTMVWGGKGTNETWFTANPEAVHGINWLPIHGGSLYLGQYPDYVRRNYQALVDENGGTRWDQWADLIWMYRALSDPEDALRQFNARPADFQPEAGNSLAHAYRWIAVLSALGRVDRSVTADYPLYAVFRNGQRRTYVVYNMTSRPRTVTFSDGTEVECRKKGHCIATR